MARARLVRTPLTSRLTPPEALRALRGDRRPFALIGAWAGGGAVLGSEPVRSHDGADPFALPVDELYGSGFHGGWVGWLGYRLGALAEPVPPSPPRPVSVPEASMAFYDHVLRLDGKGQWWFEALWTPEAADRLTSRLSELRARLAGAPSDGEPFACGAFVPRPSPAGHAAAVATCLEYIRAGDLYQANVTLRLEAPFEGAALDLFARGVAELSPRYAAYVGDPAAQVVSFSPELFLARDGRGVRSAPIKGTAPRSDLPGAAQRSLDRLVASSKDRAENVMILDLMRNDLGRVCSYGSVAVSDIARPEAHAGVWHLVSEVVGTLRDDVDDAALLRATFPPGSVTGAPKVKAMEVISTLESTGREIYTGAVGYVSPVAGLELNVAIRTFEVCGDRVWLGAGGGIVADSDPDAEYEECLVKAEPLLRAVGARLSALSATPRSRVSVPAPTRVPRPDPALGVFTTLLVRDGKPLSARPHVRRLCESVEALYGVRVDRDAVLAGVASEAARCSGPARLRIDGLPSGDLSYRAVPVGPDATFPPSAVALDLIVIPGGLGEHKWVDRRIVGGPESLIVDLDGTVLETSRGSVWIVEGDRIVTPPLDGRILPGVTRDYVLAFEDALVEELAYDRLLRADAIFVTSAIRGLQLATLPGHTPTDSDVPDRVIQHLATTASLAPAGR